MMTSNEIQSLYDAMNTIMVSELPEPLKEDEPFIWVKGLAKVHKSDCSTNWAIVKNDGYGKASVVQDFGHLATIVSIDEVHPTHWLKGQDMPVVKSKTDMVNYLFNHGEDKEVIKSMLNEKDKTKEEFEQSKKEVKALIIRYAEEDIEKRIAEKEIENEIYEERVKAAERGIEEEAE